MKKEETPLQAAKRRGEAYVVLTVDERHLKTGRGKVTIQTPVNEVDLIAARHLLDTLIGREP